jgi:5S rRNA maturation endonuclease (ribonuclease M5)
VNLQFFLNEIQKIPGRKIATSKRVLVLCPFRQERTPSCSISLDTSYPRGVGRIKCWGCGHKCDWNELAEKFGLSKMNGSRALPKYAPNIDMAEVRAKMLEEEATIKDFDLFPLQKDWRGFEKEFLTSMGARLCFYDKSDKFYVFFPVNVGGKEVGYFRAMIKKPEEGPSYLNKKGEWVKKRGLFLFDEAIALMKKRKLRTIVLVEGPRDALRLMRDGIPTCAILGTQNWTTAKRHILEAAGVKRVIVMMDGDLKNKHGEIPGKIASEKIVPGLRMYFDVKVYALWKLAAKKKKKLDPCTAPDSVVAKVEKALI